jgi:hypothetical protein
MKNFSLSLLLLSFIQVIQSQPISYEPIEHLIPKESKVKWGGFAAAEFKASQLIDETSTYIGIKGGATINRYLAFGLAGGGFLKSSSFTGIGSREEESTLKSSIGYGGLFVEYIGFSHRKVHFTVPVVVGPGAIAIFDQHEVPPGVYDEDLVEAALFMVLEPGLNLELNLTREVRFFVGGTYRLVSSANLDRLSDKDLSGFGFNAGIKIGGF